MASPIRDFLGTEAAGGVVLILAAGVAMLVANSPFSEAYFQALHAMAGPLSLLDDLEDDSPVEIDDVATKADEGLDDQDEE